MAKGKEYPKEKLQREARRKEALRKRLAAEKKKKTLIAEVKPFSEF